MALRHYSVRQTASETMKVSGVQVVSLSFITDNVIMTESLKQWCGNSNNIDIIMFCVIQHHVQQYLKTSNVFVM